MSKYPMQTNFNSSIPAKNKDLIHELSFYGKNSSTDIKSSAIQARVDPDGVISESAIPGQLIFLTAGDDGKLKTRTEIDKYGRLISYYEQWSITSQPNGSPLRLIASSDEKIDSPKLSLNGSRGSWLSAKSLNEGDYIFKISFNAHDGFDYRESSSIESIVSGPVSYNRIPSKLSFNVSDAGGDLKKALEIEDSMISAFIPLCVSKINSVSERDRLNAVPGMIIFLEATDTYQGYTRKKGWVDLNL